MKRIAVKYQGKPLMPMKSNRVTKFIISGKGKIRYDRKLKIHYLQLLQDPSGYETQDITIGLDPGSNFDGFSVVSGDTHHVNIELIHRVKKGQTSIKSLKIRQSTTRRVRRTRLRHRRSRFSNRTKQNTLSPTIRSNIDFRKWLITKLMKMYPVNRVVIEDVKYDHFTNKNGGSFSLVEQGKNEFYKWIKQHGLILELYRGFQTKQLRINTFGGDPKIKYKGARSFEAHCVDSFVIACDKEYIFDPITGEIYINDMIAVNDLIIRKSVIFIEKIVKIRRRLTQTRKRLKNKALYYHLKPGGVKEYYQNYSSHRQLHRIKLDNTKSNHPPQWNYIDRGVVEKFKYFSHLHGGTVFKGVKKYFVNNEWQNRIIS